jgi:hypothetical protein
MAKSKKTPKHLLRRAYMQVIRGYTKCNMDKFGEFYLKHLDVFSSEDIDEKQLYYQEHAKSRGLTTEKDKLKDLEKEDLWSDEKESKIKDLEKFISSLRINKSKFILKADIESVQKDIERTEKELIELLNERAELVGFTVESFSAKKVNEFFIYSTSFKDLEFKKPLFTKEEYDELTAIDIQLLINNYNEVSAMYAESNMKRIALSGFFLNSFYLCKDSPFNFFGKPVIQLTFNQKELFSLGRYFKNILQELKNDPDDETMDDPDKLIELFNVSKNSEKIKEKMSNSDATSVVGATQEDLERMGITSPHQDGAVSLSKAAAEKGGSLEMEDLMKLHGL